MNKSEIEIAKEFLKYIEQAEQSSSELIGQDHLKNKILEFTRKFALSLKSSIQRYGQKI